MASGKTEPWMYLTCEVCKKRVLRKRVDQKTCGRRPCALARMAALSRDRARKQRERDAKRGWRPAPASAGYTPVLVVTTWRSRPPHELTRDFSDRFINQRQSETTGRRLNSVDDFREAVES